MASLLSNLTSTPSRLTLLRKQLRPKSSIHVAPFLHYTTDSVSLRYSSHPRAVAMRASSHESDEELVVLGIETSCDDTAAAVVSVAFLPFSFCGLIL